MKKIFTLMLLCTMTLSTTYAQKSQPAGLRLEIAEAETDHGEYSIFTYTDDVDPFAYYLSVGRLRNLLLADEILGMNIKNSSEVTICLGTTCEDALATLETLLDLLDKDYGTTADFYGREVTKGERLGTPINTTCTVNKKLLGGKRLEFVFPMGKHTAHAYLTKQVIKQLRTGFKLDMKIHPKHHQKK